MIGFPMTLLPLGVGDLPGHIDFVMLGQDGIGAKNA
jgi:hypothetical protein